MLKSFKYISLAMATMMVMTACSDDDTKVPGNPVMEYRGLPATVYFGDNLPFTVTASDDQVPLSTVKAFLYVDGELVDTETVRTKVSGETYTGTVQVPYMPYATGSQGRLRLVLQNINFTITETETEFTIEYPDFPYLTLRAETGDEYTMQRTAAHKYEVTDNFPGDLRGVVISPAYGDNGRQLKWGFKGDAIVEGGTTGISFRSLLPGAFTVSFDTFTYDFDPKGELKFDDVDFIMQEGAVYQNDFYFTAGQTIETVGFPDFAGWWVDEDYFTPLPDGNLTFNAADGYYRVTVDLEKNFFVVKKIDEYGELESLQSDGTGTIWMMGTGVGKPDYTNYQPGWVPDKKIPFAPIGDHKYRLTFIAGKSLHASKFTLRLFDQATGWGPTFTPARLTLDTDLLMMNVPGKEAHNIYLSTGTELEPDAVYVMTVDLSQGNDAGVLTLVKK